jgi:uncharacterized protein with PQ loop repeat
MNPILNATVVAATLLGSGMALPQARRLFATRRIEGVSASWVGVSIALNTWWLLYGVAQHVWVLVPVSGVSLALYLSIAVVYLHSGGPDADGRHSEFRSSLRSMLGAGMALGAVPLIFLVVGGWPVAGVVVGLCYGLQLLPAVVTAYRGDDLRGISAGTWVIALLESLLWLVYGLGVTDVALIAGGASGVVMASLILVRLHTVRSNVRRRAVDTDGTVIRVAPAR